VSASTCEIAADALTNGIANDAAQAPAPLRQEGQMAPVPADCADDGEPVHRRCRSSAAPPAAGHHHPAACLGRAERA
jgi:hypothetical protein